MIIITLFLFSNLRNNALIMPEKKWQVEQPERDVLQYSLFPLQGPGLYIRLE